MPPSKPVVPHPPLTTYYSEPEQRPAFLRSLFDRTARHYDHLNRLLSFGSGAWYRRRALRQVGLGPGRRLLDVATGTGLVAREALTVIGDPAAVVGLDVSAGMLEQARPLGIELIQGSAECLPVADRTFDFVSLGYALRHLATLNAAFSEFHRVLRPGGSVLILEISRPASRWRRALLGAYLGRLLPWLGRWTTGTTEVRTLLRYYWETIEQCVDPATVLQALCDAGFTEVRCDVEFDLFRCYVARKSDAAA